MEPGEWAGKALDIIESETLRGARGYSRVPGGRAQGIAASRRGNTPGQLEAELSTTHSSSTSKPQRGVASRSSVTAGRWPTKARVYRVARQRRRSAAPRAWGCERHPCRR